MPRQFADWIEGYLEYTDGIESPEIYRRWAAICGISATLMRRVCTDMKKQTQFPNLYVIFCSLPATGKSNAIKTIKEHILTEEPIGSSIVMAPDICTPASFFAEMAARDYTARIDGSIEVINACSIFSDEWAQFMPEDDSKFMGQLADLYDNPGPRAYKTISRGEQKLEHASVNMLGGCTPLQLRKRVTVKELEGGFASRVLFITCNERVYVPLELEEFDPDAPEETDEEVASRESRSNYLKRTRGHIQRGLVTDLESVLHMEGRYLWHPDAHKIAAQWDEQGMPPRPKDRKLNYYCGRRPSHFIKLCMIHAAARRDARRIYPQDVLDAKRVLLEAENTMGMVVHSIAVSDHYQAVVDSAKRVKELWERTKRPVPETLIRKDVLMSVPAYVVNSIFENLVKSGFVINTTKDPECAPCYKPGANYDMLMEG